MVDDPRHTHDDHHDIKTQRDRFLAFAFAGADFLIEVNQSGKILFSMGATKSMTGKADKALLSTNFLDLFSDDDSSLLKTMHSKSKAGNKQGPYLVSIRPETKDGEASKAFISGFSMPGNPSLFLAVSKGDKLLRILGFEKDSNAKDKIADAKAFETLIQKKIPELIAKNQNGNLTMLEIGNMQHYQKKLDSNSWHDFMSQIGEAVMAASIDGETAASLNDGKYVVLQDAQAGNTSVLEGKLAEIAKTFNLGDVFSVKSKTVEGDLPSLSEREATRAIIYTMNQMEKHGLDKSPDDLKKSFQQYLEENTHKIKTVKSLVAHQKFRVHFQPIVSLETTHVVHHEVLMRFEDQKSPYELIVLGEDAGIAPDIDISVCRQTLKYADQNSKNNIGKLAVNISGSSIQNPVFIDTLFQTLQQYPQAARHLMFEITESSNIQQLDMVDQFIQKLRAHGHKVCLDDFGAGAASFQYLHKLHVDGVKIDGAYTKSILSSPRDATMIRNLTQMCHELDIFVVAEMVETEDQAKYLRDIGVDKGQGWLFGKAAPNVVLPVHDA